MLDLMAVLHPSAQKLLLFVKTHVEPMVQSREPPFEECAYEITMDMKSVADIQQLLDSECVKRVPRRHVFYWFHSQGRSTSATLIQAALFNTQHMSACSQEDRITHFLQLLQLEPTQQQASFSVQSEDPVRKFPLVKLSQVDPEQLCRFAKAVQPIIAKIRDTRHFQRFCVETRIMPDLIPQKNLALLCAGREQCDFKKVVRLLLTVHPNMFVLCKQLADHQPLYQRLTRSDFQSNQTT